MSKKRSRSSSSPNVMMVGLGGSPPAFSIDYVNKLVQLTLQSADALRIPMCSPNGYCPGVSTSGKFLVNVDIERKFDGVNLPHFLIYLKREGQKEMLLGGQVHIDKGMPIPACSFASALNDNRVFMTLVNSFLSYELDLSDRQEVDNSQMGEYLKKVIQAVLPRFP